MYRDHRLCDVTCTDVRTHVPWLSVDEVRCPLSCLTRTTTAATSASHCCASYISHVACVYSMTRGILIRRCCVNMLLNTTGHVYAVPSCSPFPKLLRSAPTPLRELTALPQTDHTILPLSDTLASLLILFFTVLTLNEPHSAPGPVISHWKWELRYDTILIRDAILMCARKPT